MFNISFLFIQSNYDGVNSYLSRIQFNNNVYRRMLSTNKSSYIVVETPTEETFNKTNEHIDDNLEESYYSNSKEETVQEFFSKLDGGSCIAKHANGVLRLCNINNEEITSNFHDLLNQHLNGDVKCTLLTKKKKNDLQIDKGISLLGNESEETNKLLDLWRRVVKNDEKKFNLLRRNLYQNYLKLRNKSRLPLDTLNNTFKACNMVIKKYNNNYHMTINEFFQGWSTVTPHNILEFRMFVMACRLTWRRIIKNLHTEYTELIKDHSNKIWKGI
ncbi:Plasmodium exported protein (PHISTb), unknown, putative [Plasmodium sp.]|nr:Plasmodium exported protein (PHISTb), unknown, putative [Plasmodium sp.]